MYEGIHDGAFRGKLEGITDGSDVGIHDEAFRGKLEGITDDSDVGIHDGAFRGKLEGITDGSDVGIHGFSFVPYPLHVSGFTFRCFEASCICTSLPT